MFEGNESNESTMKTGQAYPKNGKNQAFEGNQAVERKNVFRPWTRASPHHWACSRHGQSIYASSIQHCCDHALTS